MEDRDLPSEMLPRKILTGSWSHWEWLRWSRSWRHPQGHWDGMSIMLSSQSWSQTLGWDRQDWTETMLRVRHCRWPGLRSPQCGCNGPKPCPNNLELMVMTGTEPKKGQPQPIWNPVLHVLGLYVCREA